MFCSKCGKQVDANNRFCMYCGNPLQMQDAHPAAQQTEKNKQVGRRGLKIGLVAGAVVLVALLAVLIGFLLNRNDAPESPAIITTNAVRNTFEQGNFTVEFTLRKGNERIDGIARIDMDTERETLNLLAELEVKNVEIVLAIYEEQLILSGYGLYQCVDISEQLEEFFDTYEQIGSIEPDWEDILDDISILAYDEVKKYIDINQLNRCMDAYWRQLNDPRWLEKNAGYSVQRENGVEKHILNPDMTVFLKASAPYFEDVLNGAEDAAKILDILGKNIGSEEKLNIYAVIAVKDEHLVSFESETSIGGNQTCVEIAFYDIGTTELDPEELKYMLEMAKKMPWN